jgi:iron complex outermembrane receptor protein
MNFSFKKIASAVALATIAGPNVSFAQSVLEEIVVTASKRATTLQEIPIAVTVTTADTIEKAQIQDLFDLQSLVPSLRISQLQTSRNANFVIRGFGNGANNPGSHQSACLLMVYIALVRRLLFRIYRA